MTATKDVIVANRDSFYQRGTPVQFFRTFYGKTYGSTFGNDFSKEVVRKPPLHFTRRMKDMFFSSLTFSVLATLILCMVENQNFVQVTFFVSRVFVLFDQLFTSSWHRISVIFSLLLALFQFITVLIVAPCSCSTPLLSVRSKSIRSSQNAGYLQFPSCYFSSV